MKEIPPNNNWQVNLTNCDKEEIHLLGKIQSNGNLLAFDIANLEIRFFSQGINELFGIDLNQLLSTNIRDLFDLEFVDMLQNFINSNQNYLVYENVVNINNKNYQIYISNSTKYISLEFEWIEDINHFYKGIARGFNFIDQSVNTFDKVENEKLLSNSAVNLFRAYTGFDRVMIYKFDENGDGDVIAEDKTIGLESLYGNHYPASDIPKQARLLYLNNKVRAINDVDDEGKNIIYSSLDLGNQTAEASILDLSFSLFRHVSPIHLQYLKNMGVKASHSVSIVVDKKLWGLIICHNYDSEKFLAINSRMNTVIFANIFSNKISLLNSEKQKHNISLINQIIQDLKFDKCCHYNCQNFYPSTETNFSKLDIQHYNQNYNHENIHHNLKDAIESTWSNIKRLFDCHALCYFSDNEVYFLDDHFEIGEIIKLNEFIDVHKQDVYLTNSIQKSGIKDLNLGKYAGLLRIKISEVNNISLYLFKLERKKLINWAGNPNQNKFKNDINSINPRNSFENWIEQIDLESEAWAENDSEYATYLRNSIISFEIESLKYKSKLAQDLENNNLQLQKLLESKANELELLNFNLKKEINEKNIYQKKLEIAKSSSEQLVKIKSDILANLSHEMRTPLNGILGISMIIKSGVESNELDKFIDLQIESCQRLLETINRILELSKIENSTYNFNFEIVDIKSLIQNKIQIFELLANSKNQSIKVVFHQNNNQLYTDALIFEQILNNLVSNAIKYTKEFGKIEVNWKLINENANDYYLLQVEDNGIGIAKENFENVFNSFFLENDAIKQKDNSSGLGLYLVKNYVNYLNSEISLESEKNVGSKFTVKFPVNSIK